MCIRDSPTWACTPEEATAKRKQLAKEVAKLTEQNPDKCQLIDQRMKELETADKKAEN